MSSVQPAGGETIFVLPQLWKKAERKTSVYIGRDAIVDIYIQYPVPPLWNRSDMEVSAVSKPHGQKNRNNITDTDGDGTGCGYLRNNHIYTEGIRRGSDRGE